MTYKRLKTQEGFTLIEILVVIVIIAMLAAFVAPALFSKVDKASRAEAQMQIKTLTTALNSYRLDNGTYPTTEQGLAALQTKPTLAPVPENWDGPYLEENKDIPKDPWSNDYIYTSPGVHNPKSFDLSTLGKDGKAGGEGSDADITNWSTK